MIESRSKEMSIRKVLGAGVPQIVYTLSREFMLLVIIAVFLAVPVGWYFGKEWLQNFAYHAPIALGDVLTIIVMALLLTLVIVGMQALRAAFRNTVNGLRSE